MTSLNSCTLTLASPAGLGATINALLTLRSAKMTEYIPSDVQITRILGYAPWPNVREKILVRLALGKPLSEEWLRDHIDPYIIRAKEIHVDIKTFVVHRAAMDLDYILESLPGGDERTVINNSTDGWNIFAALVYNRRQQGLTVSEDWLKEFLDPYLITGFVDENGLSYGADLPIKRNILAQQDALYERLRALLPRRMAIFKNAEGAERAALLYSLRLAQRLPVTDEWTQNFIYPLLVYFQY